MKNYNAMAILALVLGCGLIAATCWHIKNKSDIAMDTITPLEDLPEIYKKMNPSAWPPGYPVSISELAYIKLRYWGFDHKEHTGVLIVNKTLAQDILEIFTELYKNKFPIEKMRPIYEFNNSDDESMAENNTSAFNCREVTGQPGIFSQHSYGRAVDINPKINPYVKNNSVLPENGREHADRSKYENGKITRESLIYTLFTERGWDWGGNWNDLQDFQHFEKRPNGEKRNPNGYSLSKI